MKTNPQLQNALARLQNDYHRTHLEAMRAYGLALRMRHSSNAKAFERAYHRAETGYQRARTAYHAALAIPEMQPANAEFLP